MNFEDDNFTADKERAKEICRRMIAENLRRAGLDAGCWLLEIGVENGEELAKHTLNPLLGVVGGISILGTTGLVRPYSHEAYIETVRICVKSHHTAHGTTMVFCTGGRTKSGAERRLPHLPETAFACIGDFIAESLAAACEYGMREIAVACMAGKLCKYAAGFENTHAHKVSQDMDLLRAEVRNTCRGKRPCTMRWRTAFPCGKRFCPSPKRIGPASSGASPAPPSDSSAQPPAGGQSRCGCLSVPTGFRFLWGCWDYTAPESHNFPAAVRPAGQA